MAEQYSESGDIIEPINAFQETYGESVGPDKLHYKYPLHDESRHYVKFWIHVDEESQIWQENDVEAGSYVDNTEQNRLNRGLASKETIETGAAAAGAIAGAMKVISRANADNFKGKYSLGTISAAVATGGAAGAAAGYVIGGVAAEKFRLTKRLKKLKHTIDLYVPAGISSNHNFDWQTTDDKLIAFAQSDMGDITESIKKALKSPGAAFDAASDVGRVLFTGGSSTVSNLSRTALNPRKDVLFKSVGQRQFQFDFQFASRSKEEAMTVNQIIFMFKFFSHPEVLPGYGQFLALYPAEFDIDYMFIDEAGNHVINPHLSDISSCVCTNINISYAANGSYQSLMNGEPTIVNMSLRFMEIEVLHQGRIRKGY